jgi:hypothetical protein
MTRGATPRRHSRSLRPRHRSPDHGATWLDRQNIAREPVALSEGGFGAEVRQAMERRAEHLVDQGLGERHGQSITFTRNLIDTLRRRGWRRSARSSRPRPAGHSPRRERRICRRHLSPALHARLRPLRHDRRRPRLPARALDALPRKQLGRHVSGVARGDGGVDWSFGRKRGLGL